MSTEPIFVGDIVGTMTAITDGTQTAVFIGDASNPSRIDGLSIVNLDAIAHTVEVYINDGTSAKQLCIVEVPVSSGDAAGTAPFSLLASNEFVPFTAQDNAANTFMDLPADWDIELKITTSVTSGIVVAAKAGRY